MLVCPIFPLIRFCPESVESVHLAIAVSLLGFLVVVLKIIFLKENKYHNEYQTLTNHLT